MRVPAGPLLLVLAILLGACTSGGPGSGSDSQQAPSGEPRNLAGRTFLSVGIDGRAMAPGSRVRLSFDVGRIGAQAGCNTMGGPVEIVDGRLALGDLGTTEMACDPALMDQDRWLAEFLDGARIDLYEDTLTLSGGGVTLTLVDRRIADPDRPLVGTRWVLDGLVAGEAVSSVPAGVVASLSFSDGQVHVEAGCNGGGGPAEVADRVISFGALVLTDMHCGTAAMAVEDAVTAVLSGVVDYTIEASTLALDAGGVGLTLRAAP